MEEYGIEIALQAPWQNATKYILKGCPWNPDHTDRSAYILQFESGAIVAGCHHDSCSDQSWKTLSATYWRLVKRMGKKKALVALGHLILRIAYHILLTKEPYKELGTEYLAERERDKEQRVIRQLQLKGYQVSKVS